VPHAPITIRFNPRSGGGRAALLAARLGGALDARGLASVQQRIGDEGQGEAPGQLVLVGGDGTIHHALPESMARDTPLVLLPAGNENLIAREMGWGRDVGVLAATLAAGVTRRVDAGVVEWSVADGGGDVGRASGPEGVHRRRPFVIMLSVGFDANVVDRLDASPRFGARHIAYVGPVLAEVLRPSWPVVTVVADGKRVVTARPGLLVIANSRRYALEINPCPRAEIDDGLLDYTFMPMGSRGELVEWLCLCAMGRHVLDDRAVWGRAAGIEMERHDGPLVAQIDGEAMGFGGARTATLRVAARAVTMMVS